MKASLHRRNAWLLVIETLCSGAYVAITRGLFVVYLTSMGYGVKGVSTITLTSALITVIFGFLIFRRPFFVTKKVKFKLTFFHVLERAAWTLIPLTKDLLAISALYAIQLMCSFLISVFISYVIYGSFDEATIRDVTAKRSMTGSISSILGMMIATALVYMLHFEGKLAYVLLLGASIGFISSIPVVMLNLSHLEGRAYPKVIEEPEKIFSSSLLAILLTFGGNLLGIAWIPYVMNVLGGADYVATSINLIGTLATAMASLYWRKRSFRAFTFSIILYALSSVIILVTPLPTAHVAISAYTSFMFTGANFAVAFLYARYSKWFGAIRSSILLSIFSNLSMVLASLVGLFAENDFFVIFMSFLFIEFVASILALMVIPETALIPEDLARMYSQIMYSDALTGFRVTVELSKETLILMLRLLALALVILALYVIYRALWILINLLG